MLESFARLTHFLIREGKVVVRIGVCWSELDRDLVGKDRFLDASRLIEHVAEIEIGKRVTRIGLDRVPVMCLSQTELLPVVVERSQVDVSSRVCGLEFKHLVIRGNCLDMGSRI